eukprot:135427_1
MKINPIYQITIVYMIINRLIFQPINAEIHSPNSKRRKLSTQTMNETNENNVENNIKTEQSKSPKSNTNTIKSIQTTTCMGVINTIANVMGNTEFLGGISKYLEEYQFD